LAGFGVPCAGLATVLRRTGPRSDSGNRLKRSGNRPRSGRDRVSFSRLAEVAGVASGCVETGRRGRPRSPPCRTASSSLAADGPRRDRGRMWPRSARMGANRTQMTPLCACTGCPPTAQSARNRWETGPGEAGAANLFSVIARSAGICRGWRRKRPEDPAMIAVVFCRKLRSYERMRGGPINAGPCNDARNTGSARTNGVGTGCKTRNRSCSLSAASSGRGSGCAGAPPIPHPETMRTEPNANPGASDSAATKSTRANTAT